ncbi:MAG TPA: DegV family protein [Longimicrobiales bacterium]|nr:DegV family protein [Longimicrobiales bacterium]
MRISYLDGARLRRSLVAAAEYAQQCRAELNRINVFPVPDGDTGTNLALTVRSISDRMHEMDDVSVGGVARGAAEAAVMGARGNCGMILSHFLLGFSEGVADRVRLSVREFAAALRSGADHVYAALERPVEGTILTIIREVADRAERAETDDFADFIEELLEQARDALARTPDLLPRLREAGVVDAGAKGFVAMLEGVAALIEGDPVLALREPPAHGTTPAAAARVAFTEEQERFRFCTEALVRARAEGASLPDEAEARARLRPLGDSLIVIRSADLLKVHVHTDEPEAVFGYLRDAGQLVTHKAEDMHAQHAAVERAAARHVSLARRPVVLFTDSAADLPPEVVSAHGIQVVPLSLIYDDEVLRDGVDISPREFVERLLAGDHPTTSQPTPASFLEAMRRCAEDGEEIFGVLLASSLSGTYASAEAAAKRFDEAPVHLFDSGGASLLQGLLTLRAAELAEAAVPPADIIQRLARARERSGLFFTVDTFDRLIASGRVGRGRALLGTLLDIKPILALDRTGIVAPIGRVRGRENVLPRVMELLEERAPRGAGYRRFGIVHVACEQVVTDIEAALRDRYGPDIEVLASPATPVIATHAGAGAWGLAWLGDDEA